MEQTDTKEIVKEALNALRDKIVISYDAGSGEDVESEIEHIANRLTALITNLEEFAFNSARSSEEDEQYTFTDYEDFKNAMNGH